MNIKMRSYPPANKKTETVLQARAEQLAKKKKNKRDEEKKLDVVEFKMADERYGIELSHTRMIHSLKNLTYIPGTPGFIKGIINVHGKIISIVDLRLFFDLPEQEPTGQAQAIILSAEEMEFGILADKIIGVKQIAERLIQPSLVTLTGIRAKYLKGVTGDGLAILDGGRLLSDNKMVINIEVAG